MKSRRGICARLLLWSLIFLLAVPPGIMAQDQAPVAQVVFSQEQLDQMLAPIALYPDEVLVQLLMAATYPLEVVQAARWAQANAGLTGDQLAVALEQQPWDPSVKSLVNFPSVLQMMNDRLDWMQQLGDAFLGQKDQVMATVQQLRERAQAQGNLTSTTQETVVTDPQSQQIIIEPASPQVVYVPVYDPLVVYGPWWWPAYRPHFWHPPGVVIRGGVIGFGLGVTLGLAWGYAWGGFDWHRHDVVVNVNHNVQLNNRIDRNRYVSHVTAGTGGQGMWRHDPVHRQGVAYRTPTVAEQYGRGPRTGADTRQSFRGFGGEQGAASRAVGQPRQTPAPQGRVESPRQPAPAPQPRVTPAPAANNLQQGRFESQRQPAVPSQARVTPAPNVANVQQKRVESQRQPAPAPQPRVTPAPAVASPQPSRQPASPGRATLQGVRGSTAFGGSSPGTQTQQFSNRGHESLGSTPSSNRAAPTGGSHGGAPQGGSHGNQRGGR